jgi:hypothetical protein
MLKFYLNNNKTKPGTYPKKIEKILPQKKILLVFMGIFRQFFFILLKFYLNNKWCRITKAIEKLQNCYIRAHLPMLFPSINCDMERLTKFLTKFIRIYHRKKKNFANVLMLKK